MKKQTQINGWKKAAIVFVILIIFVIIGDIYLSQKNKNLLNLEKYCDKLPSVPSWVKFFDDMEDTGVLLQSGMIRDPPEDFVNILIGEKIYFYYSSRCPYCQEQIELFGDDWEKYVDAGLTIDCYDNE